MHSSFHCAVFPKMDSSPSLQHLQGTEEAARDIAMHIAVNKPSGLTAADVPEATLAEERRVAELKAVESGKPEAIAKKMVEGQVLYLLLQNLSKFSILELR